MRRARAELARWIGRHVDVRGVDRVVRLLHSPDGSGESSVSTTVEAWDGTRYHVDTRSFLEWRLFVYGDYEGYVQRAMRAYLRPGDVVLDCGANVGIHACALARVVSPGGLVIAVEPVAELAERLERNRELNALDNVVLVRKAASAAAGEAPMFVASPDVANQGQGSLHRRPELLAATRTVAVDSVDGILREHGVRALRLIKIDVEGHELGVLQGARESVVRWRPYVFFEYDRDAYEAAGTRWADVAELVAGEYGYELRELTRKRVRPLDHDEPSEQCMVIASPRE